VPRYNGSLDEALAFAGAIDGANLSATTEPTQALAIRFWDNAYHHVRLAFRMAGLDPDSLVAGSTARRLAETAEAYLASGQALGHKHTITGGLEQARDWALGEGYRLTGKPPEFVGHAEAGVDRGGRGAQSS